MASGSFLGVASGTGAWGGYGTAGYSIFNFTSYYDPPTQSLPPTVTSVGYAADGDYGGLNAPWSYPDPTDDRCIRLPDNSKSAITWTSSTASADILLKFTAATESTRWRASVRLCAANTGRPATATLESGGVAIASIATGDLWDGRWVRFEAVGSVNFRAVGTYPRVQGVLFDPPATAAAPGRLLCFEPGATGLLG